MSETGPHSGEPDSDLLAGEYVLGVLSQAERREAERRIVRDAFFARAVRDWEDRLLPWANSVPAVPPPDDLWQRILAVLPQQAAVRLRGPTTLPWWRALGVGASALAIASTVALFVLLRAPAPETLTASLDGGGHRHFVALVDLPRNQIIVSPAAFAGVPGRAAELWLIAPGTAPKSLGLLSAEHPVTVAIPPELRPQTDKRATLAVTIEPPGGAPNGIPTGDVVAQGKITSL